VLRIVVAQLFPLKTIQDDTITWAFGNKPAVRSAFDKWFRVVMADTFPRKARPVQFTSSQLSSLSMPVLFVLGKDDNLVGDPRVSRALTQDIPDVRVKVLDTGHLIAVEQPQQVNQLIIGFLGTAPINGSE
jgi:pimeloyl-ACP methyl ester carboxylesterase